MVLYRADWVVPVSGPPIRDGWLSIDRGRIASVGRRPAVPAVSVDHAPAPERDLGRVAVLPGLVNAHTHLELSYLRDVVPPASNFVQWARHIMGARRGHPDPWSPAIIAAVEQAIEESKDAGTALVGDISNTLVTPSPLAAGGLGGVVFYELLRFRNEDADAFVEQAWRRIDSLPEHPGVRVSLAAHAPYSVGPLVFRAITRQLDRRPFLPCSVHLSESAEEVDFVLTGQGPWRQVLEELGSWDESWRAPGVSPVRYLEDNGFLARRPLVVHGVQMSQDDLGRLARHRATLVTCPRSNGHTGAGAPPISDFYASGVRVAIGTDSLASAPDLSVFAELATLRALTPDVAAATLIESATLEGARALGFESEYGSIEPGKRARLVAVSIPEGTSDVEEYLVSGVTPDQVSWIED